MSVLLSAGDARSLPLRDGSVHCCVCSPPYWSLRDYGTARWEGGDTMCNHNPQRPDGGQRADRTLPLGRGGIYRDICGKCGAVRIDNQLGLEKLHDCLGWTRAENCGECYVCHMRLVAAELWRVLREDGTLWMNLGDGYANTGNNRQGMSTSSLNPGYGDNFAVRKANHRNIKAKIPATLKHKDLVGIPWRVALALQADGWYLRSDIIWSKPNPMPESVTDRPTKSHEYIFLLSKSPRYYFDQASVREEGKGGGLFNGHTKINKDRNDNGREDKSSAINRNIRSVWHIATQPYPGSHYATYPEKLVEPCIKAGTSERGCCPGCGKPWTRVVERENMVINRTHNHPVELRTRTSGTMVSPPVSTTLGWRPACSCPAADPVPCTVLDPFAGSGTTGVVARRLGRHFIGLDLSYQYLHENARERLGLAALDAWVNGRSDAATASDLPLFAEQQP